MIEQIVQCYQNKAGEWLIFPLAVRPGGHHEVVNRPQRLPATATEQDLGRAIFHALQDCDHRLLEDLKKPPQVLATKSRSYGDFARKWALVLVAFSQAIRVIPTRRDRRGSYWHLIEDAREMPPTVPPETIAQEVVKAMGLCHDPE